MPWLTLFGGTLVGVGVVTVVPAAVGYGVTRLVAEARTRSPPDVELPLPYLLTGVAVVLLPRVLSRRRAGLAVRPADGHLRHARERPRP